VRRVWQWWRGRHRDESGYVAVVTAVMFATAFLALAATAVDTANWYVQAQKLQNAADAAALGGVIYMPQDLPSATTTAAAIAKRNGYDPASPGVTVTSAQGDDASQLRVTVSSTVRNTFGALIGLPSTTITRTALADFTGPAPMGSPCNTFGTEPDGGNGPLAATPNGTAKGAAPFANCATRSPNFWSVIQGPETGKLQGDRFMTVKCEGASVDNCDASKNNTEYSAADSKGYQGYFFLVKVSPEAVGQPITLQLYDPAFVYTRQQCQALSAAVDTTGYSAAQPYNDYTRTDQGTRYRTASASASPSMCPGDEFVGTGSGFGLNHPMTTSFVLRNQTDTQDPMKAGVTTGSDGKSCIKQYGSFFKQTGYSSTSEGTLAPPTEVDLRKMNNPYNAMTSTYNRQLAKVFHNWVDFCTFTPTRAGDYYLQVRTNVALGGTPEVNTNSLPSLIYQGNPAAAASTGDTTTGEGANGYAIRAVVPGYEKYVAVAGYDRMPIFENGTSTSATFNLMRVLPGAKGYSISFSFFDVGDALTGTGSIKVLPPLDATGSITTNPFPNGCTAKGGAAGSFTNLGSSCSANITSAANNGKLETMTIPIPSDYNCTYTSNGGCWYRVQVDFPSGTVFDTTTWTAGIISDPVRLVE
jgi:Flp pilus assembly protein TadG